MSSRDPLAHTPPQGAFDTTLRSRRRAASLLLLGGGLTLVATFLPYARVYFPGEGQDPASTTYRVPGLEILQAAVGNDLQRHLFDPLYTCLLPLIVWGAPLVLLSLGLLALRLRQQPAGAQTRSMGIGLVVLGMLTTFFLAWLFGSPFFSYQERVTLSFGPAIALVGYALALVGIVRLPHRTAVEPAHA